MNLCNYTYIGMKALILDPSTTQVVSMVYSQTQILEKEVYLVEQLGKRHESMNHLKAAVFVRPTEINIEMLLTELKSPQFSEYHIFFSNIVPQEYLNRLARADEKEVVRQVQEYYGEYLVINDDLFHLGMANSLMLSSPSQPPHVTRALLDQTVQGILSVLLSLKRRPSQIRYQCSSEVARRIATEAASRMEKDDVFDFRRQEGPLLLLLDRRDDPITPLLTQWTYQAMVHELLGLNNNRVILKDAPGIRKDLEEVVISTTTDDFFAKHKFSNFGDLGTAIKNLLDDYQHRAKMNENITSIEDMQAFMERYPAFRSHSLNVSKHVALMSELARLVDMCHLLDISQLEQDMSCSNDHSNHKRELLDRIGNPSVQPGDKIRLAVIYLLHYESYDEAGFIKNALISNGLPPAKVALIDAMLDYAGDARRAPGLFSQGSFISKIGKTFASTINGVQNVYTQHVPLLDRILESYAKGKLKDSAFPLVNTNFTNASGRPSEVIVFIAGGVTYEEALKVSEFNASNPSMRVTLGGSYVHNSVSFTKEVESFFGAGRM